MNEYEIDASNPKKPIAFGGVVLEDDHEVCDQEIRYLKDLLKRIRRDVGEVMTNALAMEIDGAVR